jgi:hypothetical protein
MAVPIAEATTVTLYVDAIIAGVARGITAVRLTSAPDMAALQRKTLTDAFNTYARIAATLVEPEPALDALKVTISRGWDSALQPVNETHAWHINAHTETIIRILFRLVPAESALSVASALNSAIIDVANLISVTRPASISTVADMCTIYTSQIADGVACVLRESTGR